MLDGNARQYTSQDIVEILSPDYPKSIPVNLAIALSRLTELNLFNDDIGDGGAEHIAGALKCNTTLLQLNLGFNNIGEDGAKHIADALKYNTTLQTLDLGGNDIGDNGAKHIAGALNINTTLKTLNLGFNNIGDDGARELYNAIQFYNIAIVALIPSVFDRERRGNFILQNQNVHKFIKDIKKDHFSDGKSQYKDLIPELKTRSSFAEYHLHFLYYHCVCNTKKNGFDNTPLSVLPNEILFCIFEMCNNNFFDAKYQQQPTVCRLTLATVMRELKNDLEKGVRF